MARDNHDDGDLVPLLEQLDEKIGRKFNSINDRITGLEQRGIGGGMMQPGMGRKSLGGEVLGADGFGDFAARRTKRLFVETQTPILAKSTILGEAGSPQNPVDAIAHYQSMQGIAGGAFRQLNVLDLIPRGVATSNQVHFTREASWVNGAAETAEAAMKPEASATFEAIDAPVRTIAHWMKASRQVLDDAPALQAYLDQRLRHGVLQRLEAQIIAGNGTSPNLSGLSDSGNHVALVLATGDDDLDAASKAKHAVLAADYAPSAFLLNPADWGRMERKKTGISGDATPLGAAGGALTYLAGGLQPILWGLPVVPSNNVAPGTFFCLSRDAVMMWERQGATVEMFDQNEDDAVRNLILIRAEMRAAFAVFQPAAVVYGTWPEA